METNLEVIIGNIEETTADAIVNAANSVRIGGGGIDGAIHRAAGPKLAAACAEFPRNSRGEWCPTGEARVTKAFRISSAQYVIHTAGPNCSCGYAEARHAPLLASCYRAVIAAALENKCSTLAIPCISTGIFGFPMDRAVRIAVRTANEAIAGAPDFKVTFVIWAGDSKAAETKALYESEIAAIRQSGVTNGGEQAHDKG